MNTKNKKIHNIVYRILKKYKLSTSHAKICADALINAEQVGAYGHGLSRLKMYCDRIKKKVINAKPKMKIKNISQSISQIDANDSIGFVAADIAIKTAIKNAKKGLPEGSSYLSYLQTNGRGRNNNKWVSMRGNLFLSTIFRPITNKVNWHQLSLIIGLSILETLIYLGVDKRKILLEDLKEYREILSIGSGRGITSIKKIQSILWKRASTKYFQKLKKDYETMIKRNYFEI